MEEQKKNAEENTTAITGTSNGPQGVDKAPGEETSENVVEFSQDTQKGKKVDADPEQESDRPASQSSIPNTGRQAQ